MSRFKKITGLDTLKNPGLIRAEEALRCWTVFEGDVVMVNQGSEQQPPLHRHTFTRHLFPVLSTAAALQTSAGTGSQPDDPLPSGVVVVQIQELSEQKDTHMSPLLRSQPSTHRCFLPPRTQRSLNKSQSHSCGETQTPEFQGYEGTDGETERAGQRFVS